MSEWNKNGEECDCGSTTEHKRSPGCTSPADTSGCCYDTPGGCDRHRAAGCSCHTTTTGLLIDYQCRVHGCFGRTSPAEALIYERRPDETCSCARLNAREGPTSTYYCSRCPSAVPGEVYERGGYMTGCERHTVPVGPDRITPTPDEQKRRSTAAQAAVDAMMRRAEDTLRAPLGDKQMVGLGAMLPPLTPAAMLGEALTLANRAEAMAFEAHHAMSTTAAAEDIKTARVLLIEATTALKRAIREAEARSETVAPVPINGVHIGVVAPPKGETP